MNAKVTYIGQDRAVHLIDVENICGTPLLTPTQVAWTYRRYRELVHIGAMDQVIMASAHINVQAGYLGWPDARREMRSGPDGAELRLAEIIADEHLSQRFERVYVASGDHLLAKPLASLASLGAHTTVVSWHDSLSAELRLAAHHTIYLDTLPDSAPLAA